MAQSVQTRMAAIEFLQLPESNLPSQLIDGEVIMTPAPDLRHQELVFKLAKLVESLMLSGKVYISPVDVHLDALNVVQPDVLWVAEQSTCTAVEGKYLRGAPDLVIEVLSPGTALQDRGVKFELYERYGSREYWMVDPAARYVEVWQRGDKGFVRLGVFGPEDSFMSLTLSQPVVLKAIFSDEPA